MTLRQPSDALPSRRFVAMFTLVCTLGLTEARAQGLADEERDWGVPVQSALRGAPYSAPTPLQVPGARTVRATELRRMLAGPVQPLLIDVAAGEGHVTLAGALWWPGMGRGANFIDAIQAEMAAHLARATGGDKARPIAFFCVNAQCWLSYNASLRAAALGYGNVLWFRGGVEAWRQATYPMAKVTEPWAAAVTLPTESAQGAGGRE